MTRYRSGHDLKCKNCGLNCPTAKRTEYSDMTKPPALMSRDKETESMLHSWECTATKRPDVIQENKRRWKENQVRIKNMQDQYVPDNDGQALGYNEAKGILQQQGRFLFLKDNYKLEDLQWTEEPPVSYPYGDDPTPIVNQQEEKEDVIVIEPIISQDVYIRGIHTDEQVTMSEAVVTLDVTTSSYPRLGPGQYVTGYEEPQDITIQGIKVTQDQLKSIKFAMATTRKMRWTFQFAEILEGGIPNA